jgi:hypothetical protein
VLIQQKQRLNLVSGDAAGFTSTTAHLDGMNQALDAERQAFRDGRTGANFMDVLRKSGRRQDKFRRWHF